MFIIAVGSSFSFLTGSKGHSAKNLKNFNKKSPDNKNKSEAINGELNKFSGQNIRTNLADQWDFIKTLQKEITGVGGDVASLKKLFSLLEKEGVANDINGYPKAPPSIRIWGGSTVENENVSKLLPWLDWSYEFNKGKF